MKKYIKQIAALALIVSFASCSPDDEKVDMLSTVGGSVVQGTSSISRLENSYNIPLKLYTKEGITVTKVEIFQNEAVDKNGAFSSTASVKPGKKVVDATITAATDTTPASAVFNSSTLEQELHSFDTFLKTNADGTVTPTGKTGTYNLVIVSTYSDGTKTTVPYALAVGKAIVWKDADGDNEYGKDANTIATSGVTSVKYRDTTSIKIRYAVVKKSPTIIDNVTSQWKIGANAAYSHDDATLSTKKGSIDLATLDYVAMGLKVKDTLFYKFTIKSGTQTDFITTAIVIKNQNFDASKSGSISEDVTMNKFNLATATTYPDDTSKGEIVFESSFGFSKESTADIHFVTNTGLSYSTASLFDAEAAYNAGTKVASVTDLNTGDVVLYQINRKNVNLGTTEKPYLQDITYYGLLKVGDKTTGSNESFNFDYKEGQLKL